MRNDLTRAQWIELGKQARSMVTTSQVAEAYGMTFDRRGFAPCPFHHEKTASFHIKNPTHFHCFGCNTSPDVIDLCMGLFGLSYADALRKLNKDFALGMPVDEPPTADQSAEMHRRMTERKRAEEAEAKAQAEYDALWEAAMDELARVQCAIRALRPPCGEAVPLEVGQRLGVLYGELEAAKYRYMTLPDEGAYIRRRVEEILRE